jgi:hypothetical protein
MSDFASALPIRSEADGTDARVQVKIVDGLVPSQIATVDTDKNVHIEMHGNNPAGSDVVARLSEQGAVNGDGKYHATNNSKPDSTGLIAHDRGASIDETSQNKRVTAVAGADNTVCLDIALRDESGAAFSASNPLPVTMSESEGTEVWDYQTSASLAANASTNFDYTVTALKTLLIEQISASASAKIKMVLKLETSAGSGTFSDKAVRFNSTASPNVEVESRQILKQVAGAKVRVTITNTDNQAQDVYYELKGIEV